MAAKTKYTKSGRPGHVNTLRIIGGRWRGRLITFVESEGLRPTPDRVRETLFNWLQPELPGSRCLDLFAGSGALGFEALSRGAAGVIMVEAIHRVNVELRKNADTLKAQGRIEISHRSALDFISDNKQIFDIIFLDPPFSSDLLEQTLKKLSSANWVVPGTLIYVESDHASVIEAWIPETWMMFKEKTTSQVCYRLIRVE